MHLAQQLHRHLQLLRRFEQFVIAQVLDAADLGVHAAHMAHGLHDVARARLALGADHRGAFGNAAQGLPEVARSADEGDGEDGLVDVVGVVGWRQHFGFVDVVDVDGLEDLCLGEVSDAAFRHDGDGDGGLDALDHGWVAHSGHAAGRADVGGDALERHNGRSSGGLGDAGLLGGGDVHDDAALQHLGELAVQDCALDRGCVGSLGHESSFLSQIIWAKG